MEFIEWLTADLSTYFYLILFWAGSIVLGPLTIIALAGGWIFNNFSSHRISSKYPKEFLAGRAKS